MDLQLADADGFNATELILTLDARARIIILTQYNESEYREGAKMMGVCGYVVNDNLVEVPKLILSNS